VVVRHSERSEDKASLLPPPVLSLLLLLLLLDMVGLVREHSQ
jgi:hypothetical protein